MASNTLSHLDLIQKYSNEKEEVNFQAVIDEMKSTFKPDAANSVALMKSMPSMLKTKMEKMMQKMSEGENENVDFRAKISNDPILYAFAEKKSAHTGGGGQIIPPFVTDKAFDLLADVPRTTESVAYINVPFCQTRCAFCMFYIGAYKKEESKRYADALIKELQFHADRRAQQGRKLKALYFGGGTPTALEAEDLYRIIKACREYLPLTNDCEITVEGRLSYFDERKIEATLKAGANRFSMGIQTFDTRIRQALGRISTTEELIRDLTRLASYDEAAIVIDLMFGLPGQDEQSFLRDLEIAKECPIAGLDLYQLILLESSPLEKLSKLNKTDKLPNPIERANLYRIGANYLLEHNFKQLSASHFAINTRERNIYNVLAKSDADTLAFGPGAGGKIQGISFMNKRNYSDYINTINNNQKPVGMMFMPHPNWRMHKKLGQMLELGFIDLKQFKKNFHQDLLTIAGEVFENWQQAGLLKIEKDYIKLNQAGLFWSVTMSNLLIKYLIQVSNS